MVPVRRGQHQDARRHPEDDHGQRHLRPQTDIRPRDQRLDQRHLEIHLDVQQRHQDRRREEYLARPEHAQLSRRPAQAVGYDRHADGEAHVGAVHVHEHLLHADQARRRQADAEGHHRHQRLHDEGQQRADDEGQQDRAGRDVQAGAEPGLLRQGRRRLLDQDQAEEQGRDAEQHRAGLAVIAPAEPRDDHASDADAEQRGHPDVHGDDEQDQADAHLRAEGDGIALPRRDQARPQHADGDEGYGRRTLGDGAGEGPPAEGGEAVVGQAAGQDPQARADNRLEVLGKQPHPEEEQANAAQDAAQHFNHTVIEPPSTKV